MAEPIHVIGHSAITCLGPDIASTFRRLAAGESGIDRHPELAPDRFLQDIAGRVRAIPSASEKAHDLLSRLDTRFLHLALPAAEAALRDAGVTPLPQPVRERTAIVVGSAFGGLDLLEAERQQRANRKSLATSPYLVPGMIINQAAGLIAQVHDAHGPTIAPANACATGGQSLILGAEAIRSGQADIAICGAAESVFIPEIVNGFATMRALLGRKPGDRSSETPALGSRPFSRDRAGFVLSEGAGMAILASESIVRQLDLVSQAELLGWASNSDGFHMALPDPGRIARCLSAALDHAGVGPEQIDYYNAHGTSTVANDRSETEAIKQAFGDRARSLAVSSVKGALGHAMGAASAIEAAVCVRALIAQVIPPTLHYLADPELDLDYVPNTARPARLDHVMSAAFGFGGTNNALIFRRTTRG